MKTKYLRVTMPDGSKWDVPAQIIAENRAHYYANEDTAPGVVRGDPPYEAVYAAELAYALGDDYELQDWAANNMNWSDVEKHAVKAEAPTEPVDYQEGWVNGEKEIVEKQEARQAAFTANREAVQS